MQFKEKKTKDGKEEFVFTKVIKTEEKQYSKDDIATLRQKYTERKARAEAQLKESTEMLAELDKAEGKLQDNPKA